MGPKSIFDGTYTAAQLRELRARRIAWAGEPNQTTEALRERVCSEGLAALVAASDAAAVEICNGEVSAVLT